MYIKAESGSENILSEKPFLCSLLDCDTQTGNSYGIFSTNIEISVFGTDRITCNYHPLNDRKRIPFKNRTVHKRSGISFVTVADNIFFIIVLIIGKLPLSARWKSAAAASAES